MAVSAINTEKEKSLSARPLLLLDFVFSDGATLHVSSQNLTYSGTEYLQRLQDGSLDRLQSYAQNGIDTLPRVSFRMADADLTLYNGYEAAHGFRGAIVKAKLVFWEVATGSFSPDSRDVFTGQCDAASWDNGTLTVTATNNTLTKSYVPNDKISARCSKLFPSTAEQRAEAYGDEYSPFNACGYSPENGRGVVDPGTGQPFVSCPRTIDACVARGLAARSGSLVTLGAFNNVTFFPPDHWVSRAYGEKENKNGKNAGPIYGQLVPHVIGTAWVDGRVISSIGDGNSTRGEVIVCGGMVGDGVLRVVVGGVEVPRAYPSVDPLFCWRYVNTGGRDGVPLADAGFDGKGDPHGSRVVIEVVVYSRVTDNLQSSGVRVLARSPLVRVYSGPGSYTAQYSENPAWHILDRLLASEYTPDEVDIATFVAGAAIHDGVVNYTDQNGAARTRPRHSVSLAVQEKTAVADLVDGLRRGALARLVRNGHTGKLEYYVEGTLGDEQPAPIPGSNDNVGIASKSRSGGAKTGYSAYLFDESNILGTVSVAKAKNQEAPNRSTVTITNRDNVYSEDTVTVSDTEDVGRVGYPSDAQVKALGITTADQARVSLNQLNAKALRGNHLADTSGTESYSFNASYRASHLRVGHIVRLTYAGLGLTNQLCRVESIQPAKDWESAQITVTWHEDEWYTDAYGQTAEQRVQSTRRRRLDRPPLRWYPAFMPTADDAVYEGLPGGLGAVLRFRVTEDGSKITGFEVHGKTPVNRIPAVDAPVVPLQGTSSSSGGAILGDRAVYVALRAVVGSAGALSSPLCIIDVPNGTSSNRVTVSNIIWPTGTTGHEVYAGFNPLEMALQSSGSGAPTSVTINDVTNDGVGQPDLVAASVKAHAYEVTLAGPYVGLVAAQPAAARIQCGPGGWSVNEWAGRKVSIFRVGADGDESNIVSAIISSNTEDTLTLDRSVEVAPGDYVVIRCVAGAGSTTSTIQDAKLALSEDAIAGDQIFVLAGPGYGYTRTIKSNTGDTITLDSPLDFEIDGAIFVVVRSAPAADVQSQTFQNEDLNSEIWLSLSLANISTLYLLVGAAVDDKGNESPYRTWREAYLPGQAGTGLQLPGALQAIESDPFLITGPTEILSSNGTKKLRLGLAYNPPEPLGAFSGVSCHMEFPDGSGEPVPMGDFDYNGDPAGEGAARYGTCVVDVEPPLETETERIYLTPRTPTYRTPVIRHGHDGESASRTVVLEPVASAGVMEPGDVRPIGEHAFLIEQSQNDVDGNGIRRNRFRIQYDPPSPIPPFIGVALHVSTPDGRTQFVSNFDYNGNPAGEGSARYGSFEFWLDPPAQNESWSFSLAPRSNTFTKQVTDATPKRTVAVLALGAAIPGAEWTENATDFTTEVQYRYSKEAGFEWRLASTWTPSVDPRYGGARYIIRPVPAPSPVDKEDRNVTSFQRDTRAFVGDWWLLSEDNKTWDVFLPGNDIQNRENSINTNATPPNVLTPVVRVNVRLSDAIAAIGGSGSGGGKEYADFITDFTVTPQYGYNDALKRATYWLRIQWRNPADVRFSGVRFVYREQPPPSPADSADISVDVQYESKQAIPTGLQVFDWGKGDNWIRPAGPVNAKMFGRSLDWDLNANTIVALNDPPNSYATPSVSITVTQEPSGGAGQENAPLVTGLSVGVIHLVDGAGVDYWAVTGVFNEPASPKYGGCRIFRFNGADPMASAPVSDVKAGSGGKFAGFQPSEPNTVTITFAALSYDIDGKTNTYVHGVTPTYAVTIPAQQNTLKLALAEPGSLQTAAFATNIRPVQMVSSLPALPNPLYPALSFFTFNNGATRALYRVNAAGTGFEPIINGQTDIQYRSIVADNIATRAIATEHLVASEILVGGGGNKPTRFRVDNSMGGMVGFIGDNGTGYQGAYFVNLRIGTDINAPAFYADASQVYLSNVKFTLNLNGVITQIANLAEGDGVAGLIVKTAAGNSPVRIRPGSITIGETDAFGTSVFIRGGSGADATISLYASGTVERIRMTANGFQPSVALWGSSGRKDGITGFITLSRPGGVVNLEFLAGWLVGASYA